MSFLDDTLIRTVAAFGAVHMDTLAHCARNVMRETSTPAHFIMRPGGVAANVARAVARLNRTCVLVGRVGQDANGDELCAALTDGGVDVSAIERSERHATGCYLALHDPDGSLAAAAVDSALTDTLTPGDLDIAAPVVSSARIWFLDANLPTPVLVDLVEKARIDRPDRLLIADAVSAAKASRLANVLPSLDCLFCNRMEAASLSAALGQKSKHDADSADLAAALLACGAHALVITDGPKAVCVADRSWMHTLPIPAIPVVDVTGAGDALIAGTIAALSRGAELGQAVPYGVHAARLTVAARGAAPDTLSWAAISSSSKHA